MHIPVLVQEVVKGILPENGDTVLDATVGNGGHSGVLCSTYPSITIVGIDADENALSKTREQLQQSSCTAHLARANFRDVDGVLSQFNIKRLDSAIFDLGLRGEHLDESGRGFSFQKNEPLVMTFSAHIDNSTVTARTIVNEWSEKSIADILYGFGEEHYASHIAQAIVKERVQKPIETTHDLVEIVESAVPAQYRHRKIHSATKTFQALRIAVNDELGALEEGLRKVYGYVRDGLPAGRHGGRIAVISFHSLEDRLVKRFFREMKSSNGSTIITKKPITPTPAEIKKNRRSRSAKLRILQK